MSVVLRTLVGIRWSPVSIAARGVRLSTISAALAFAGCSADITRFDNPSFALGEGASTSIPRRSAGGPPIDSPEVLPPPQPYAAAPSRSRSGTEVAALPALEPSPAPALPQGSQATVAPIRPPVATRAAASLPATPTPTARGEQIEVQQGDTLYGIGKRHHVMISDLMAVNDLKSPNLKPGQKLYLPSRGRATPQVRPDRMAVPKAAPIDMTPVASAPAHVPGETYVVKPGDSLYAIAARHKVKLLDLQNANSISDVRRVKPGMVLKLPSGVASAQGPSIAANTAGGGETVRGETRIVRIAHSPPASTSAPAGVRVLNGDGATGATNSIAEPTRVAAADTGHTASDAAPIASTVPATAASGKLRWPVKGRIVQGFGQRADGSHNDGIDISVPAGTDVMAAEAGVVAYAGSEVKTYGNLVLIRHDNGWVTAYAYNEKLLVQRGDRVRRGQLIAKAGKSGGVDQPQLHFEIRVGSRPVDPTGYLEKM